MYTMTVVATFILLAGLGRQHCDFGARLLDELLQVHLSQLLGQLLQIVLHVLQGNRKVILQTVKYYQRPDYDLYGHRLFETVFGYIDV